MPIVKILPNETFCPEGAEIEVATGAKIAQALNKAGIKLPHACEYNCACATCHIIVREGFDTLNEPEDEEYDQLDNAFGSCALSRLACQTVMGSEPITIEIPKNNRNLVHEH
ncbi:MAG: 2Fe-2S iron-sulfur cluster-binding protein [Duodenibacillus sp.]